MSANLCHHEHHHHQLSNRTLWAGLVIALILTGIILSINPDLDSMSTQLSTANLTTVFILGILGASSHCIMLVGGLLLTAISTYQNQNYRRRQIFPVFFCGRLFSFALGGFILGRVGESLTLNQYLGPIFIIVTSLLMLIFSLDLLGFWCWHHHFEQLASKINHLRPHLWWLFCVSALTFFVPCSFTNTAQLLALTSGSGLSGAIIMSVFVAGTTLPLLAIGYTGSYWHQAQKAQALLTAVMGWFLLIIAVLSFNEALETLKLPHLEIFEHDHHSLELNQASQSAHSV